MTQPTILPDGDRVIWLERQLGAGRQVAITPLSLYEYRLNLYDPLDTPLGEWTASTVGALIDAAAEDIR